MQNNYALITGALSGIGLEYCRQLAVLGYNLLMVDSNKDTLRIEAFKIERDFGVKTFDLSIDLACKNAAQRIFTYCADSNIIVDILINSAEQITVEGKNEQYSLFELNQHTVKMLSKYFSAQMRDRRYGYILNMTSLIPGSKTQFRDFSFSLHDQIKDYGVGVTTISYNSMSSKYSQIVRESLKAMFCKKKYFSPNIFSCIINRLSFYFKHVVLFIILT